MSPITLLAAGAAILTAIVLGITVVATGEVERPARMPVCATTGPVSGLDSVEANNARTIVAVAEPRGGRQAATVAVMVALTESGLRALGNPAAGIASAGEGLGYDHDSLGLFQQRAGWGTAAERMDPVTSTNLFLDALVATPRWDADAPWVAAQRVQRSAFDGRPSAANRESAVFGGNYQAQLERAEGIIDLILTSSSTDLCEGVDISTSDGPEAGGTYGLASTYSVPADTTPMARVAVTYALAQLGKPYLWGGRGPDRFDCSGLTQRAWAIAGQPIGRSTYDQLHDGTETTVAQLQPGDLVLIPGSQGTLASPGHIGMYIGNDLVVHAPRTGDVVRVTSLAAFVQGGISGLRHIG